MPMSTPRRRKRCDCRVCGLRSVDVLRSHYMRVIAGSYDREELKRLVRIGRAALLPKDPT